MPEFERQAFTRSEIALMFGVSDNDVSRAIHSGALRAKRPGRQYLIHIDDAKAWFEALPDA